MIENLKAAAYYLEIAGVREVSLHNVSDDLIEEIASTALSNELQSRISPFRSGLTVATFVTGGVTFFINP